MSFNYSCPNFPPITLPYPLPSGHCQFDLDFHVFGYILLTCLFCWLDSGILCSRKKEGTLFLLKKDFIYLFLEKGEGKRKRGRETSTCGWLLQAPYWGPGLQPAHVPWLNQQPFGLQACAQTTEPHQPGRNYCLHFTGAVFGLLHAASLNPQKSL